MGAEASVATGQIRWYGYLLGCRECDSTDQWTLSVEHSAGNDGEVSWLGCGNGHRVRHPLIYPEVVHRVIGWATSPDPDQHGSPSNQKLCDWLPHWTTPEPAAPAYRDWTEPGPVKWDQEWPELIEAYKIIDKINDWQQNMPYADELWAWQDRWGTTEPDVRHVEILESRYRYADLHKLRYI
jgi:hypothetical protein